MYFRSLHSAWQGRLWLISCVRLIFPPITPNGIIGPWLALWSEAPSPSITGGACHPVLYKEMGGWRLQSQGLSWAATPHWHNPKPDLESDSSRAQPLTERPQPLPLHCTTSASVTSLCHSLPRSTLPKCRSTPTNCDGHRLQLQRPRVPLEWSAPHHLIPSSMLFGSMFYRGTCIMTPWFAPKWKEYPRSILEWS